MILLHGNTSWYYKNTANILLAALFLVSVKNYAQQWELRKDKSGVKIYTRTVDTSKINEYRAIVLAKTSIAKALKVITDGDHLWKWNYKTSQSKIQKTISDTEFVFWMKNDLPWPIKDRDLIARIKVFHQENGSITIDISPETINTIPVEDNTIRIKNFKGHWLLVPQGEYVEITQQLYGDPGGNLPAWILNSTITTSPYRTFLNLKEILEN